MAVLARSQAAEDFAACLIAGSLSLSIPGSVPEWPKGTGCKPVGFYLRRFKSSPVHDIRFAHFQPFGAGRRNASCELVPGEWAERAMSSTKCAMPISLCEIGQSFAPLRRGVCRFGPALLAEGSGCPATPSWRRQGASPQTEPSERGTSERSPPCVSAERHDLRGTSGSSEAGGSEASGKQAAATVAPPYETVGCQNDSAPLADRCPAGRRPWLPQVV